VAITPGDCIVGLGGALSGSRLGAGVTGYVGFSTDYVRLVAVDKPKHGRRGFDDSGCHGVRKILAGTTIYRI
jgi:hypothetical protein